MKRTLPVAFASIVTLGASTTSEAGLDIWDVSEVDIGSQEHKALVEKGVCPDPNSDISSQTGPLGTCGFNKNAQGKWVVKVCTDDPCKLDPENPKVILLSPGM